MKFAALVFAVSLFIFACASQESGDSTLDSSGVEASQPIPESIPEMSEQNIATEPMHEAAPMHAKKKKHHKKKQAHKKHHKAKHAK